MYDLRGIGMTDQDPSSQELLEKLRELRLRVAELETRQVSFSQVEERLSLFRSLVESSNEAIAVSDPEGRILYVNQAHETLFRRTRDQAKGLNYRDYYRPQSIEVIDKVVAPALARGESWEGALEVVDANGRRFPVWEIADTVRDEDGEVIFCFTLMHDISDEPRRQEALQKKVFDRTADLVEANESLRKKIIEHKHVEGALRESEAKFRQLSDVTFEGIAFHEDGYIVHANQQYYEMFGYSKEELQGCQAIPFTVATESLDTVIQHVQSGNVEPYEAIGLRKDGSKFPIEVQARSAELQGRTVRAAAIRDISDRKRAEDAQIERESLFRQLIEQAADAIFIHDFNGAFIEVNDAACETLGYTRDELLSMSVVEVDPDSMIRQDKNLFWSNLPTTLETKHIRKDGTNLPVEVRLGPVEFGRQQVILALARDITERKKAEEALRKSEEKNRLIFENIQDAYYETLLDGTVVEVSPSIKELSGYRREELIGASMYDLHSDPEQRAELMKTVALQGSVNDYELLLIDKDRTLVPCSVTAQLLYDDDGKPYKSCGTLRNITDRKKAEEQIKASLREKEVLLREIHHRVKNNLAVVNSLLRLQSKDAKDQYHRQMFLDAQDRIRSMALAHERLSQTENLANVNIGGYVSSLVDHLLLTAKGIGAAIDINKDLESVQMNIDTAVPLGFLINELVSNALKYAYPDQERGSINIFLRQVGENEFELAVKDEGVGIPENVNFEQPQSLGLNLVKLFTLQLGGEIELVRNCGTEFRIRFRDDSYSGRE
jgi:PAS domain S-box-containing protein